MRIITDYGFGAEAERIRTRNGLNISDMIRAKRRDLFLLCNHKNMFPSKRITLEGCFKVIAHTNIATICSTDKLKHHILYAPMHVLYIQIHTVL